MLRLKQIKKDYDDIHALTNVSLTIPKGSCYGLVGPNGAGKSTLIKIITSIIQDYDGETEFTETNATKKKIGYIPQEICLEETVTAFDNLYFFGKLYGLGGTALKNRANEVLSEIGLENRGKDKVTTFSGGMKRRLNIGCALMHKPDMIIMDEPTVGIDPQSRRYIFEMIEQFKSKGCTIIYASHYMEEVEELCDEVAFMDQGKVVENGSIEHLLQQNATPSVYIKGENCLPDVIGYASSITNKNGGYFITTNNPLNVMDQVLRFCKNHNGQLDRLELVQPRLEEVFFSLTGSQLRD